MNVLKIGYAIKRHVLPNESPTDRSRSSMMERIERVRKVGDVSRSSLDCKVQRFRISLRMAYKNPDPTSAKLAGKVYSAIQLRRESNQPPARRGRISTKDIDRARVAVIDSEVSALERAAPILVYERSFKVNAKNASA